MKKLETSYWQLLMWLLIACLSLGQLLRFQLTTTIGVYPHDLLVVLSLLGFGLRKLANQPQLNLETSKVTHRPLLILLGCWVIATSVLAVIESGSVSSLLYVGRLAAYFLFVWLLSSKLSLAKGLEVNAVLLTFFGLLQYLVIPDTRFLKVLGWDDHYFRLIGTQLDPNFTGALLVISFFGLEFFQPHFWLRRGVQAVIIVALALTFSRSSYVAFTVGIAAFTYLQWCRQQAQFKILLFLPLLFLGIFLAPKPSGEGIDLSRTASIYARQESSNEYLQQLSPRQLLLGAGLFTPVSQVRNELVVSDHANVPDSIGVLLITGLGVGGTLVVLLVIWRYRSQLEKLPSWSVGLLVSVIAHSLFNNTLFQPFVWLTLLAWLSVGYLSSRKITT